MQYELGAQAISITASGTIGGLLLVPNLTSGDDDPVQHDEVESWGHNCNKWQ
jgi:hypothetical protein